MNNKLVVANIKLVDENKTLKRDIVILEQRIEEAKKYCEVKNIIEVIKLLDGEELD